MDNINLNRLVHTFLDDVRFLLRRPTAELRHHRNRAPCPEKVIGSALTRLKLHRCPTASTRQQPANHLGNSWTLRMVLGSQALESTSTILRKRIQFSAHVGSQKRTDPR